MKTCRIILWFVGVVGMLLVCIKMVSPITEQETINSEKYLMTEQLEAGDVLEQSILLEKDNLSSVEVAFVYDDTISKECKVVLELAVGENVFVREQLQVSECPKSTLFPIKVSGVGLGDNLAIRITNNSDTPDNTSFSLLYTDSEICLFDNVTSYSINGNQSDGQLISRYTYNVGYDYYKAITAMFAVLLVCIILDTRLARTIKAQK